MAVRTLACAAGSRWKNLAGPLLSPWIPVLLAAGVLSWHESGAPPRGAPGPDVRPAVAPDPVDAPAAAAPHARSAGESARTLQIAAGSTVRVRVGSPADGASVLVREFTGGLRLDERGVPDRLELGFDLRGSTAGGDARGWLLVRDLLGLKRLLGLGFRGEVEAIARCPVPGIVRLRLSGSGRIGGATRPVALPMYASFDAEGRVRLIGRASVLASELGLPACRSYRPFAPERPVIIAWDLSFARSSG